MDIQEIKSIFSAKESNYLKYSEAREILKSVSIDLRISDNAKLALDQFFQKDLESCRKTNKIKLIVLRIHNLVISHFRCLEKKKNRRYEACNAIIMYAQKNTVTADQMMESLENFRASGIKRNLLKPIKLTVDQPFQHHLICDKLAAISVELKSASPKKQKVWINYLQEIHNTVVVYPDHSERKLKTTIAKNLLDKEAPKISVITVNELSDSQIVQMMKIEKEAFCAMDLINKAKYDQNLHKRRIANSRNIFYLAKDANNIVGVLEYNPHSKLIYSLARRAKYSQCRVASLLWEEFSKAHTGERIKLYVRESNPAIGIYEKWGFKEECRIDNFYQQPSEDALLMKINS